jgi:iron(III) transport system substrate-binding protein
MGGTVRSAIVQFRSWVGVVVAVAAVWAVACAPAAQPAGRGTGGQTGAPVAPAAPAAQPAPAEAADPAAEWEQVVAAAKREGRVVVISQGGTEIRDAFTVGFQQKYPEIQVEYTGATGAEVAAKLLTEQRAGQYRVDVLIHGTTTMLADLVPAGAVEPIVPYLVGPESRDPSKWLGGKFDFADDDAKYNLVLLGGVKVPLVYNPRLVNPSELRSFKDLADPKWQGKIAMIEPRLAGSGLATATFLYANPGLGEDYLRQLFGQQGVVFTRDDRQLTDWVARGQHAIGLAAGEFTAVDLIRRGVTIEMLPPDALQEGTYLTTAFGSTAVPVKAPHPNAAKVYLDWLLSKEAQIALTKAAGYPDRRLDIPREEIPIPFTIPKEGVRYQESYKEPYVRMKEQIVAFLKSVLGE